jgi:pyruvate dehydrogenase E2 component (dihydrolipoamide acetyltransferase)
MPKFGATMQSGEINEWNFKVGDRVNKGDELCVVSSDKITNPVEAYVSGVIVEILVDEGEEAEIGAVICRIREE